MVVVVGVGGVSECRWRDSVVSSAEAVVVVMVVRILHNGGAEAAYVVV